MGLFSKFRKDAAPSDRPRAAAADGELREVREARVRARRRLIGAVLLLGLGLVAFPLIFETQPRPVPVDVALDIPDAAKAPPLVVPRASTPGAASVAVVPPPPLPSRPVEVRPQPAAASPVVTPVVPAAQPPRPADTVVASTDARTPPRPTAPPPEAKPPTKPEPADAAADSSRFVVQVGAFAEADSARTARRKVEAMGLKTYTQEVSTAGGKRIRVRVGPYTSRGDAQKAADRIKAGGLPAAVLTL